MGYDKFNILICILIFNLSGCAFLPVPWQFTVATTAGDIVSTVNHGKTLNETAASLILEKDCQWSRTLIGWKPCLTREELIDNLHAMNCERYDWNFINIPYCVENKDDEKGK